MMALDLRLPLHKELGRTVSRHEAPRALETATKTWRRTGKASILQKFHNLFQILQPRDGSQP